MNNKPNVPGEIYLGQPEYSWRVDTRVSGWLIVATLISACSDIVFLSAFNQWPLAWKIPVVLAQFIAISLWARNLTKWICGMDELHRRITMSAVLFSISATFFFVMLWHRLDKAGFFQAIFPNSKNSNASWDIATLGHTFLLMTLFYFVGFSIFNRRYK